MVTSNSSKNEMVAQLMRLFSTLGIFSFAAALFVAGNFPGNGAYEVSIYQAYPALFWALLIVTVILGSLSVFGEVFITRRPYGWVIGFLLVVATNALILSLAYLRDYAFTSLWDGINHYSLGANILAYGSPGASNFYPISHLIAVNYSYFTGIDLQSVMVLFPALFYIVYLANAFFLAYTLEKRFAVIGLSMVLASPLLYGTYSTIFRPTHFTVYMLPFFIGWLYKTRLYKPQVGDIIAFVILLFFLPFLHPWAVVGGIGIIVGLGVALAWVWLKNFPEKLHLILNPLFILGVTWLTWFMTFQVFGTTMRRLVNAFLNALGPASSFGHFVDVANRAGVPLTKLMSLTFYTYGSVLLYLIPAGIVITWVVIQMGQRRRDIPIHLLVFASFIIMFIVLAIASLFRDLFTQSPLRILNIALVCVPILISGLFYDLIRGPRLNNLYKQLLVSGLFLLFLTAYILGAASSYFSPLIGQPSHQFTYAEQAGIQFLVDHIQDDNKQIYSPFGGAAALGSALNATDLNQLRQSSQTWYTQIAPRNFADAPDELGYAFHEEGYLWLNAYERAYYTEVWPSGGRFTPQSFDKLTQEPQWHLVYTSGEFTLWRKSDFNAVNGLAHHE